MTRRRLLGNSLMEYALPATIILITAGVLASVLDIQGLVTKYFLAGSGHKGNAVQNQIFKPSRLARGAKDSQLGNGSDGHFDNFGLMVDGAGRPTGFSLPGTPYTGAISRSSRQSVAGAGGNEDWLYPSQRNTNGGRGGIDVPAGASDELRARVEAASNTTRMLGLYQAAGDQIGVNYAAATLSAQQAGTAAYAGRHGDEVARMNPSDLRRALTSMGSAVDSADIPHIQVMGMDLGEMLRQATATRNIEGEAPLQEACAQRGETCGEEAAAFSALQQLLSIFGGDPSYVTLSQGATPREPDEASRWYDRVTGTEESSMTREYEAAGDGG